MHQELKRPSSHFLPGAFGRLLPLAALLLLGLCAVAPRAGADIDTGINRTVWGMLYGVTDAQLNDPVWLAADDDGDGLSNGAELAAGTNPFDRASTLAVSSVTMDASHKVSLTFPTVAGKLYVLQQTTTLASVASWANTNPSVQVAGDGTAKTLVGPAGSGGAPTFYRVAVQDVDTDGDGVSDWAEKVTGFDPATAHTHGATDDDHTALANDLTTENTVTITSTKASATQPADAMTEATDVGTFTITRGGTLHFNAITVPLTWGGTALVGTDYAAMPASVTFPPKVGVITLTVVPLANAARRTGATVTVAARPGGGYRLGAASVASVAVAPASNANGLGLTGDYYTADNTVKTYTVPTTIFVPGKLVSSHTDAQVDFTWATSAAPTATPGYGLAANYYAIRWSGQVQPQYSETYYFDTLTDDGVKLWVNGQLVIDGWSVSATERVSAGIALQAGVLYDIRLEYFQYTGTSQAHLYWYSNSQPKQIIPTSRLYPATMTAAPPAITSAASAVGFVNQPFSFAVTASNSGGSLPTFALGSGSGPLPPGLILNAATGIISGTPTAAGDYQVALVATNTLGTGAGVLDIQILSAGSGITREVWQGGVTGTTLADIPLTTTPTTTDTALVTPEDNTAYPARTGVRLRGYFTAPATGNYHFWLAANNNAELWVSNDAENVNKTRRAWVTAPGTAARGWATSGQTHQRSPWLSLVAGQRYYYEALYNSGDSGTSNLAVGWLLDANGAATTPVVSGNSGVGPGYVLSQYDYPTTVAATGSLYVTNLSPQGTAVSAATGSANLRMNSGNTQAILHFNYGGLSSPRTAYHIHAGPDQTGSGPIVFDLDDVDKFHPELKTADGGYIWNIVPVGSMSVSDIVNAVQQGFAYFNVHTVNFPAGEIRGNLGLVQGEQNPPVPVADPGYANDSASDAGAARFLNQAAYGASPADLASVKASGYAAWIDSQIALPHTHLFDDVQAHVGLDPRFPYTSAQLYNAWWRAAVQAPDQLRQRVAFALSEIMVLSTANSTLANRTDGPATFYDTLADGAFGNFRDLLKAVTLHPAMGYYLNMQGNPKGNLASGLHPNENYGREIMQLFSIGLNRLWPDGTLVLDSQGNLVPTYDQDTITGMARVFTGWTWAQTTPTDGSQLKSFSPPADWVHPMTLVPAYHELGTKALLDNVVLPAANGYNFPAANTAGSQADPTNALCNAYGQADLDAALDNIFNHPNVGPYICRQLIQRLVASNPSPEYLHRVVRRFNDDGSPQHVRGNLNAVIRAILLDGEARNLAAASATSGGKQREPLMRLAGPARTFQYTAHTGTYSQAAGSPNIAVTLASGSSPNLLASGDGVWLDFSNNALGTSPQSPYCHPVTGAYKVLSTPAPTASAFTVSALGLASAAYTVAPQSTTPVTYLMTVNTTGPAVTTNSSGNKVYGEVYLQFFPAGSGPDGPYTVTDPNGTSLQVYTASAPAGGSGSSVYIPKMTGAYVLSNPTGSSVSAIKVVAYSNHNLKSGDRFWMDIATGTTTQITPHEWTVGTVIDATSFTVKNTTKYPTAETNVNLTLYPLVPPLPARSGNVSQAASKFDMGQTTSLLTQSPLNSPTVFNFFYPDYKYPGMLAAANVTTPEFQLTTDTNIIVLTNTLNTTILSSGNNSGLASFNGGSILLDLSPYMAAPYSVADAAGVGALVDKMSDLLTGGLVTPATKIEIINYVTGSTTVGTKTTPNFASTSATNVRDRVRAVVQLILMSPEYAVQR